MFTMQHLCTTNDTNGNPRRVYVFSRIETSPADDPYQMTNYYGNDGYSHIVFTFDEGYNGRQGAMRAFRARGFVGPCIDIGAVDTDGKTYRRLVKWQKTQDAETAAVTS